MQGQQLLLAGIDNQRPKSMVQIFKELVQTGGVPGLWKGCVPNVQRAALVNLGYLTGYDQTKQILTTSAIELSPESKVTHGISSIVSGLVAATLGTPADVLKTRVMNQPLDQNGKGQVIFFFPQHF